MCGERKEPRGEDQVAPVVEGSTRLGAADQDACSRRYSWLRSAAATGLGGTQGAAAEPNNSSNWLGERQDEAVGARGLDGGPGGDQQRPVPSAIPRQW